MKSVVKYGLITLVAITALVALTYVWIYARAGGFQTLEPHFAGTCDTITGPGSPEDILVDRETGIAYLSVRDRLAATSRGAPAPGFIAPYDLASGASSFHLAQKSGPEDMSPHGMSLFTDENGNKRLFVINHRPNHEESVEIFDLDHDGTLSHVETIMGALLTAPNNLVAVGPRQFYLVNDFRGLSGIRLFLDTNFAVGFLNLVYFDGQDMRAVEQGLASASGIAISQNGEQIYVGLSTGRAINIYDRDEVSGDLSFQTSIKLGMSVDNLDVAEDGSIWVGGRPNSLGLSEHFRSGFKTPAPTQVSRVSLNNGVPEQVEVVYLNAGEEISAGSVAVEYKGKMLVGSITARHFLLCELPET